MNIAIIDDISTDAEDLKNIAVFYFEKKQIQAEIYQFSAQKNFLKIISRKISDSVPGYLYERDDMVWKCAQDPKTVR